MPKNSIQAVTMMSFDTASLTANYQTVDSDGLEQAISYFKVVNNSNQPVTVSLDGSTDHDFFRAGETVPVVVQELGQPRNDVAYFRKGQQFYVKGTAGTGSIYFIGYYLEP